MIGLQHKNARCCWEALDGIRSKYAWSHAPDDRVCRLWSYYLTYCEAGFLEKHIGNAQMAILLMACEELFGFRNGKEWYVVHYLFHKVG